MKICDKCGAHNSDNNFFCVDCTEKLNDPISSKEQANIENEIKNNIENLYNDTDPLAVTLFDKIIGAVCISGTFVLGIMFFIALFTNRDLNLYLIGFLFFVFGALDALLPKITWTLEKLRLSFTISDPENAEPSDFYLFFRKAGIVICAAIGTAILIVSAFQLRHKNEPAPSADDPYRNTVIIQRGDQYSSINFDTEE